MVYPTSTLQDMVAPPSVVNICSPIDKALREKRHRSQFLKNMKSSVQCFHDSLMIGRMLVLHNESVRMCTESSTGGNLPSWRSTGIESPVVCFPRFNNCFGNKCWAFENKSKLKMLQNEETVFSLMKCHTPPYWMKDNLKWMPNWWRNNFGIWPENYFSDGRYKLRTLEFLLECPVKLILEILFIFRLTFLVIRDPVTKKK